MYSAPLSLTENRLCQTQRRFKSLDVVAKTSIEDTHGVSEQKLLVTKEINTLFMLLQPDHLRTAKPPVIFLEGPPGTGKSTTLY